MMSGENRYKRIAAIVFAAIAALTASALLISDSGTDSGHEQLELDFNGYCTIISGSLLCEGAIINYMDSIASIERINISYGSFNATLDFTPPLVVKKSTSTSIAVLVENNLSYTVCSYDGISRMAWKGLAARGSHENKVFPEPHIRLVYWDEGVSQGASGIIPFELNEYRFELNSSVAYYGIVAVNSTGNLEYIDVKSMLLHDRVSWEFMVMNQSHITYTIPFQYASYTVMGSSNLEGYPTRVTVEYYSREPYNVSVSLKVYSTESATIDFITHTDAHLDYASVIPLQYLETLLMKPGYLFSTCLPSHITANPTR